MVPTLSPDTLNLLSTADRDQLLDIAVASIAHGLRKGKPMEVRPDHYSAELQRTGASFVTLRHRGELRGCMGCLETIAPLVRDVSHNAYSAAFHDPRFPPLTENLYPNLHVSISVLSPASRMECQSEEELLAQMRPGVDGVVLRIGTIQATLLPAVWSHVDSPRDFLVHLKRKARLPDDFWSSELLFFRYTAESFAKMVAQARVITGEDAAEVP